MNASEFARRRDRLLHQAHRSNAWQKRALGHLVAEAGATPSTSGSRVIGWLLPNGQHVCAKHRYPTEDNANRHLREIAMESDGRRKPIRAYACYFCGGWHTTSQARDVA